MRYGNPPPAQLFLYGSLSEHGGLAPCASRGLVQDLEHSASAASYGVVCNTPHDWRDKIMSPLTTHRVIVMAPSRNTCERIKKHVCFVMYQFLSLVQSLSLNFYLHLPEPTSLVARV